jgi:hypothetical protein
MMDIFPAFMTRPADEIPSHQPSPGFDGHVYEGAERSQMAAFDCRQDGVTKEYVYKFDEYFVVVRREHTLGMSGRRIRMTARDECLIPARHHS